MRQKLCWASESLHHSPSMSSKPSRVMGKMGLDKPVSAQHGPRSWTGLNISSLAMTRERNRSVHARRKKEEVWRICLADVRCFLLVFEWLPCLGVAGQTGWREITTWGRPKDPKYYSHRPVLTSPPIESQLHSQEPLYRPLLLSDRNRARVVLCAFFVVESLLAKTEVAAHTREALN